jgi:hypothetical protein
MRIAEQGSGEGMRYSPKAIVLILQHVASPDDLAGAAIQGGAPVFGRHDSAP